MPDRISRPKDLETQAVGRFVRERGALYRTKHLQLYDYWRSVRPSEDRLPSRADVDPLDIPRLLANLWITEVVEENGVARFRERLVGTAMTQIYGRDTTGQWFEEIYTGRHLPRQLATYRAVVRAALPHVSRLEVPIKGREFIVYDRLILPLANDGKTPDMLLGIHAYHAEADEDPSGWPRPDVSYVDDRVDASFQ